MGSLVSMSRWSTDNVVPEHRLDYYAGALSQAIIPIYLSHRPDGPFDAHIEVASVGTLSFIRQQGSAHRCFTDTASIARNQEDSFHLVLNRASYWQVEHLGRKRCAPGDAVLVDARYPVDFDSPTGYDYLHVKLPAGWLRQWVPAPGSLAGIHFQAASGWARALTAFVASLTPDFLRSPPLPLSMIVDQLGSLLALAAHDRATLPPKTPPDRVGQIKDVMWQMCSSPTLTAADVAIAVGMPLRSFHRCFTASGMTFGRTLTDMRYTLATRMLESPLHKRLTIGEIAHRAGFCDASHLSATVRIRSGKTPTQIRRDAIGNDAAANES
ncbi:AraC family transcriptional regulator [Oxalobacteraceae bacterium OM1]|nr:AraC family transcriptional regulator [Oxalobacteraceae bacterium OM1]